MGMMLAALPLLEGVRGSRDALIARRFDFDVDDAPRLQGFVDAGVVVVAVLAQQGCTRAGALARSSGTRWIRAQGTQVCVTCSFG